MKYIPIKEYTFLSDSKKVSRTASYIEEQVKECQNYQP